MKVENGGIILALALSMIIFMGVIFGFGYILLQMIKWLKGGN